MSRMATLRQVNVADQRVRSLAVFMTAALSIAACGGSTESAASTTDAAADTVVPGPEPFVTDPTTTIAPETTAPETSAAPETIAAPATTAVPAPTTTISTVTTVSPSPAVVHLRPNGIGALEFGATTPDQLVAALTPTLGSPISIESLPYPTDSGGYFENLDEERGFAFAFGRDVCFDNGLCTYFGGSAADALTLVGYRQSEGAGTLTTVSGVTAGSIGTEFPDVIIAEAGGCYSTGSGSADGVRLFMESSGELFGYFDDVTNEFIMQAPPLNDLTVLSAYAGDEPFFTFDDC